MRDEMSNRFNPQFLPGSGWSLSHQQQIAFGIGQTRILCLALLQFRIPRFQKTPRLLGQRFKAPRVQSAQEPKEPKESFGIKGTIPLIFALRRISNFMNPLSGSAKFAFQKFAKKSFAHRND